ncbi:pilus assembly protein PilO [Neobacillus sp.]|uniref:pilus assembly protein PilO n=1 Tax=Neobacillus sp. TaxID=2675273 RepID=UPI002896B711|nr:pilus assembly protein PilO [Neobacillus sp.]
MKLRFSKRDKLIIGVGALLLVLLIVYAQFFSLTPLKSDLWLRQQSLKAEQKLLAIVSRKKVTSTNSISEDTKELQKKVPVRPLQDQFILDLEKAETVSNSKLISISFAMDSEGSTPENQANTENKNGQQNSTTTIQNDEKQATSDKKTAPGAPAGMKKLTAQLSVESSSYENFEKFIETLESLKRIVVVEAINYTGGKEITSLDQKNEPLSYTLTISAFYMPELADLQTELPKIDAPAPAGKANPLSQFPSTTKTEP